MPTLLDPTQLPDARELADLRLLAIDLDGTLLGEEMTVDPRFWGLADALMGRGVQLCAATGRQRGTLVDLFGDRLARMSAICDNGAYLEHRGRVLHAEVLDPAVLATIVRGIRELADARHHLAIALTGPDMVVLESPWDDAALEAARFLHRARRVPDVLEDAGPTLKVAVFSPARMDGPLLDALHRATPGHRVVQGHDHWVDVVGADVDKGAALRRLQGVLGIRPAQTAAFGDHLNDIGMLRAVGMSFAMANGRSEALAAARFRAPSNTEAGVVQVLGAMLDRMG
ncbi:MAG: Cof-type HAD-IIB family hydrolase [Actinomycetales bacterium]|nr:Cof-type HAD-IIB family hydrolase [Actinomycetales bacterium]